MADFQPVRKVEDFLREKCSWQKKNIIELHRIIRACCHDNIDCICANLCYVVKNLDARNFVKYLNDATDKDDFVRVENCFLDITKNMKGKIPSGKELLFVKKFNKDEKIIVCKNIGSFFFCLAGLGNLPLPPYATEERKVIEMEIQVKRAEKIQNDLLSIFNNHECKD